jgi:hypothetical protein
MQLELEDGVNEEELLQDLQQGDVRAFGQLLRLCNEQLVEYANAKLREAGLKIIRGTYQVDILMGIWQDENFARAEHPVTQWMLNEIDRVVDTIRHTTTA